MLSPRRQLERYGRVWFRGALAPETIAALGSATTHAGAPGRRLGVDSLPGLDCVTELARQLVPGCQPVRIVAFDKSPDFNWTLPWHQDRVIAVRDRHEVEGFSNWSLKVGVWHCEPPIELLSRMVFARVHIDAAAEQNGCLELALESAANGRIGASDAASVAAASPRELCIAQAGDVLFASALILHRSNASASPAPRRALRIDFSADALPAPLRWAN